MAVWQKVITSGSAAELASLTLTTDLAVDHGGTGLSATSASAFLVGTGASAFALIGSNGSSRVLREFGAVGVTISGSFSGSFFGDGSGLTGISSAPTFKLSGSTAGVDFNASTDTLAFTTASIHGFDLSQSFAGLRKTISLIAPQDLRTTATPTFGGLNSNGPITGSKLRLTAAGGGTGNSVAVFGTSDFLVSQSIDGRVWGTTLVDGSGSATRLAVWSDTNTAVSDANLTYNGTILTVNGSTFGADVNITGNLTVLGDTTILNVTNLLVEDKFVIINSGSNTGDGGLIVQSGSNGYGVAFAWDDSAARWGFQQNTLLTHSASTFTPEAYAAAVIDVDGGQTVTANFTRNGNIRIEGGEVFIYA